MSVSATGGPARPLHPAGNHSGGKRHGPSPTDFPAVSGQDPGPSALAAEEGQTAKAGREARADGGTEAPASVSPHDAYAAYQLAKKLTDAGDQRAVDGAGAARRPREAATRFDAGTTARDSSLGDDRSDGAGVDVRA